MSKISERQEKRVLIRYLYERYHSVSRVAHECKVSENTVRKWINRDFYGDQVWSKNLWPGNSPDLNPIENLWSILQESVFIESRPKNRTELIARAKKTWSEISSSTLEKLYRSFSRRIDDVLGADGYSTRY